VVTRGTAGRSRGTGGGYAQGGGTGVGGDRDTGAVKLMIGLTGGIGAGKSAVARRLAELGAIVVDADVLAREVVRPGTEGLAEIVAAFGPGVLAADGSLDRPALGAVVFGDPEARARLEAVIHPRVRARTAEIAEAAPPDAVVVNDVPLLVETGLSRGYHMVIVVEAPEAERVRRLARDRGMSEADARARIAAQATDEQRRAIADVVLTNDGPRADLARRVDALWPRLLGG
jgi:dephospho-CoA kinase